MSKGKPRKKWIKFRHTVFRHILYATLGTYTKLKYNVKVERFKEQEDRPYLVLLNHQTAYDQFFVGMSFKGHMYYMATEDIFSNGWVSSIIRYVVAPIPIKKQTTDVKAIMTCLRVAKEGGTICIAPEGNRTYSGRTVYMSPSIAPLARKLGMPIALYRIEGGYGACPRWSDVVRKGKVRAYVSKVIQPEEYASISDDELFRMIEEGLYVDEAVLDNEYHHKKSAEYIERALYYCPTCGLSTFESKNDTFKCLKCGMEVRYLPTKELEGVGFDLPYRFFAEWYDAQEDFMNGLNVLDYTDEPMYRDEGGLYEVIPYKNKKVIDKNAKIELYGDRIELELKEGRTVLRFEDVGVVTVLGRNKINVYHGGKIYQIKSGKRFNALKYVHVYHRHKNLTKGDPDGKFLGL